MNGSDYYDPDEEVPKSPGLVPVRPDLGEGSSQPLPFAPLWMPEDVYNAPVALADYNALGWVEWDEWYRKYGMFKALREQLRFRETLVLHQMAPDRSDISFAGGLSDLNGDSGEDDDMEEEDESVNVAEKAPKRTLPTSIKSSSRRTNKRLRRQAALASTPPAFEETNNIHFNSNRITRNDSDLSEPRQHKQTLPSSDSTSHRSEPVLLRPRRPGRLRWGLPLTLHTPCGLETVMACADTGSDVNIISERTARDLGYESFDAVAASVRFTLANGRIVPPMGQVNARCWFGHQLEPNTSSMSCTFYILPNAATIILGMPFLEKTKTMTEHRDRLVRLEQPTVQALSVCSIGEPKNHLVCELNHVVTVATPDSGSEVDLMHPRFAVDRGFEIHPANESIELADGSIEIANGFVRTTVSIGTHFDSMHAPRSKTVAVIDFFLLKELNHDIIIGERHLDDLEVFTENQHALVLALDANAPNEVNRVRHLGQIDGVLSWIKDKLGLRSGQSRLQAVPASSGLDDQRENDRRERESHRIALLPVNERQTAIDAEALRQRHYERTAQANYSSNLQNEQSPASPSPSPSDIGLAKASPTLSSNLSHNSSTYTSYVSRHTLRNARPTDTDSTVYSPYVFEHDVNPVIHYPYLKLRNQEYDTNINENESQGGRPVAEGKTQIVYSTWSSAPEGSWHMSGKPTLPQLPLTTEINVPKDPPSASPSLNVDQVSIYTSTPNSNFTEDSVFTPPTSVSPLRSSSASSTDKAVSIFCCTLCDDSFKRQYELK
ncbi:Nn.00g089180.m01.CDS01 [Neocucurbitaria sp. VM-36]